MNTYIQDKLDEFDEKVNNTYEFFNATDGGGELQYTVNEIDVDGVRNFIQQSLTDYHNHIVENIKNELGDFAHTRYLGCHSENDKWHYSYDTEVVYIVDEYLKSLQDTNPKE